MKKEKSLQLTVGLLIAFILILAGVLIVVLMRNNASQDNTSKNQNTNSSINSNTNTARSNTNANKNANSNANSNSNSNANLNTNAAVNANVNSNANSNTNSSAQTNRNVNANTNTNTSLAAITKNEHPVVETEEGVKTRMVNIYLIDLEDNGVNGPAVGCGDSLASIERTATVTVDSNVASVYAATAFLLVYKNQTVSGYYNALYQSDLSVDSVSVNNGVASVYLVGTPTLGGTCDVPRAIAQLEYAALQFPDVASVQVYINGMAIRDALSTR